MGVILDGEPLTEEEVATLLAGTEDLVLLRGQWVEVDRARFEKTMERFREAEALAAQDGLSFAEAMRMLAGAAVTGDDPAATDADWSRVTAGPWLEQTLTGAAGGGRGRGRSGAGVERDVAALPACRHALDAPAVQPGAGRLPGRRHGAGQDDPGAVAAAGGASARGQPSLLVAPASLLGNWAAEIEKFAPGLKAAIVHPSAMPADQIKQFTPEQAAEYDLVDHQLWLVAADAGAGGDVAGASSSWTRRRRSRIRPHGRPRRRRRCGPRLGSR